jgi:DNA modification methylase
MTYQLHHGDCLTIMPLIERESVDAIVTDPPYGLDFMGKDWDHGVPGEHFWREAYRCAKPGAHLLAFGGTRTFHRLAVAIEDAGWEIRDTVMWVYGQGFPKSHDVSKAIDKSARRDYVEAAMRLGLTLPDNSLWDWTKGEHSPSDKWWNKFKEVLSDEWKEIEREVIARNDRSPGWFTSGEGHDITAPATPLAAQWQGFGTALKPAVENIIIAQKPIDTNAERSIMVENLYQLEAQLWLLSNVEIAGKSSALSQAVLDAALSIAHWSADEPRNIRDASSEQMDTLQFGLMVHTILSTVSSWLNIWEEALKHGSTFITETVTSQIIDLRTLNSSVSALTLRSIIEAETTQLGSWLGVLPAARVLSAVAMKLSGTLELFAVENAIEKGLIASPDAIDQTVLSLPIIVARKPLAGTVAENVTRYGTGGLNIDGCRIETEESTERPSGVNAGVFGADDRRGMIRGSTQGRWPANLIHDGSAEVLAGFPQTVPTSYATKNTSNTGIFQAGHESIKYKDEGRSAARFFYCAKASKQDRDEGCEGLELRARAERDGRDNTLNSKRDLRYEDRLAAITPPSANHHPTVKPTSLMRYLCRLVTPPNGTILDPFMGSGSTGKAAMLEGFNFIGIDTEIEYVEIAARRIEHACEKVGIVVEHPIVFETKRETGDKPKEMMLL